VGPRCGQRLQRFPQRHDEPQRLSISAFGFYIFFVVFVSLWDLLVGPRCGQRLQRFPQRHDEPQRLSISAFGFCVFFVAFVSLWDLVVGPRLGLRLYIPQRHGESQRIRRPVFDAIFRCAPRSAASLWDLVYCGSAV